MEEPGANREIFVPQKQVGAEKQAGSEYMLSEHDSASGSDLVLGTRVFIMG